MELNFFVYLAFWTWKLYKITRADCVLFLPALRSPDCRMQLDRGGVLSRREGPEEAISEAFRCLRHGLRSKALNEMKRDLMRCGWGWTPVLLLAGMGCCCMAQLPVVSHHEGALWVAGNDSIEIGINQTTGLIERLRDKVDQEDYCNQNVSNATSDTDGNQGLHFVVGARPGGLKLLDELRGREFSDLENPGVITALSESQSGGVAALTFDKQYAGAEFVVTETFTVSATQVRWDVRVKKSSGPDRTVRVINLLPMPLGGYQAWAPISDAPFAVKPWLPFSIDYGQSTSGAIGEGRWRTTVPLMVFYSRRNHRALAVASPLEVPAVRIRFLSNTSAEADFHWNSREYPLRERPYFEVSNEYLGVRDGRDLQTSLLISAQPSDWRPALGWFYAQYKPYFDPDPRFDKWDGIYGSGYEYLKSTLKPEEIAAAYADEYARGERWEELHGHFAHYGSMIPDASVKSWTNQSDSFGETMTREKIAEHCRVARDAGIGTFLYYNVTESEYWFAQEKFPDSIARNEAGGTIGAWQSQKYPDKRACWLMNADPATSFGKYMIQQAKDMVDAYPAAAGFFWDVYGRSYMFDFAHDDGITMINNKAAYYPEFMYQRLMQDAIGPLLHGRNMQITANKPVTVASTRGIDGVMTMEDAPREESPAWITAQSYLGLNRHVMILDENAPNEETMYLHCLRYGAFPSFPSLRDRNGKPITPEAIANNRTIENKYLPFIEMFKGKQWIFYPEALQLPENTFGNIFRLRDGTVMITMVSAWRELRNADGFDTNLQVIARLPDAGNVASVEVDGVDGGEKTTVEPEREGDRLTITVPRHGKATVILLRPKGWKSQ